MSDSSNLPALRAELKRKLADGTYDPPSERMAQLPSRLFPRLLKSEFASLLVLSLGHFLLCCLLYLFDGLDVLRDWALISIVSSFLFWWGVLLYAGLYHQLYRVLSGYVIDALRQPEDIRNLERWLAEIGSVKWALLLLSGLLVYFFGYQLPFVSAIHGSFKIGVTIAAISAYLPNTIIMDQLIALMLFPLILSRYHIDLYELDPGASPSIRHLSLVIRNSSYSLSLYATLFTLFMFYLMKMPVFPTAFLYLIPLLGIFIFRQIGLSLIIGRARWTVLERLSAGMEQLDVEQHFDNPAIQNQYKAMLDYYNRVKNAEAGVFDARTGLLLFYSFLLPLIAFVLFQFDKIAAFIDRFVY
jgi:hypothetical protein